MPPMRMIVLMSLLVILFFSNVVTELVTISNVKPRVDINGQPMDIHDGNIVQFEKDGLYFFYGMGYGDCHTAGDFGCAGAFMIGDCGFRTNHSINLYTSPDLSRWTFVRDVLPWNGGRPHGVYYRPKVIFNRRTQLYVLWVNVVPHLGPFVGLEFFNASYVVATSPTPFGPFNVVNTKVKGLAHRAPGDFALLVDETETMPKAYIAYDALGNNHRIQIEQLTPDFTESLGSAATTGPLTPMNNEAPIFFKRRGFYYLLFGQCCCFCTSGSNSRVYVSSHPLGPWTDTKNDIDPVEEILVNGTRRRRSISGGQESFVIGAVQRNQTMAFIFVSDRWNSGSLKSNDLQYWQPLQFDDSQTPPRIEQLQWIDEFTLDLAVGINTF